MRKAAFATVVSLFVSGCVGGGSMPVAPDNGYPPPGRQGSQGSQGNQGNQENPPPPPPKPSDAPQYSINPSLKMTGYHVAHDAGFVGSNVTVAVIDSGFDRATYGPEFGNRLLPGRDLVEGKDNVEVDQVGHGTQMSRIIAASGVWPDNPSKITMVGVAPGANIYPIRAGNWGVVNDLEAYEHLHQVSDVKIVNMSYGSPSIAEQQIFEYKNGLMKLKESGKLLVVAAGNNGQGTSPNYPARFAADDDLASHMIVAGAVNDDKTIASYSSSPANTRNRYLVAPGSFNFGEAGSTVTITESGTSNATAVISGAAAVVWGRWPYLTADRVANILLETAEDLGDPGVDDVYGRGLLRLDLAMQPIGQLATLSLTGKKLALGTLVGVVPQSARNALSILKLQMLDDYGRNYRVSAQQLLGNEPTVKPVQHLDAVLQESREAYSSTQSGLSFAWAGVGERNIPWAKVGFVGANWVANAYSGTMFAPFAITDNPVVGRLREATGINVGRSFGSLRLQAGVVTGLSLTNQNQSVFHAGLQWHLGTFMFEASAGRGQRQFVHLDAPQGQATVSLGASWLDGSRVLGVTLHQGTSRQTLTAGFGSTQTKGSALVLRYTDKDVWRDGTRLTAALTLGAPVRTKATLVLPTTINLQTGDLGFERVNLDVKSRAPMRLDLVWSTPIQNGILQLGTSASNTNGTAASITWSRPF